jgi:protein-disulfide isomerase
MTKTFWGILVAVIIILGGIYWASSNHNSKSTTTTHSSSNTPTSHIEGQGKDGITLLEYGDYECPYCSEYSPIVKQVASLYNTEIYFQFRNLPLTQIHTNAFAAARAAEAAGLQGKFWQMHDVLYTNQSDWVDSSNPVPIFNDYAQQLGLNVSQFKSDYNGSAVNNAINADVAVFNKTGQEMATPTFFLNGVKINPVISLSSFEQIINAEIQKKTGHPSPVTSASSTSTNSSTTRSTQ